MEKEILLCPHIENCILYKNYSEEIDNRLGVILPKERGYECLALIATQDPITEGGVLFDEALEKRLPENNKTMYQCSHIQILNLLEKIVKGD